MPQAELSMEECGAEVSDPTPGKVIIRFVPCTHLHCLSAHGLAQQRFVRGFVDVRGLVNFDVPHVLAIAYEKASRVL